MGKAIYNARKLSEYRPLFHNRHVLVIGAGAVGTYIMEYLAKLGVSPDVVDFDVFTAENAAKHSGLIRTPEDVGRNKAVCVAERVKPLLDEGCSANGIDSDLCKLGPEAFSDYNAVFLAVDNFDAKVLFNELIRQLPEERRPIVIMSGTFDEMAQSTILDNKEFCLYCLIDDSWMKDSAIRTSCSGPQIRSIEGVTEEIRTSNLASSMAAHLSLEQFRAYITKDEKIMNRRLTYTASPNLELTYARPLEKKNCIGCAIKPPRKITWLEGSVLTKTLRDVLCMISQAIGTEDYELLTHRLNYRKTMYSGFIVQTSCSVCGKMIRPMKHEGRAFPNDLVCKQCGQSMKHIFHPVSDIILHAFTNQIDDGIKDMTLFELGYPLGAHLEVITRNGALDYLEEEKLSTTVFAMKDDCRQMREIHAL